MQPKGIEGESERDGVSPSLSEREEERGREDPHGVATCSLNFSERLKYKGRLYIRLAVCLCDCLRNSHQILDVSLNIVRFQGVERYAALRTVSRLLLRERVTNRPQHRAAVLSSSSSSVAAYAREATGPSRRMLYRVCVSKTARRKSARLMNVITRNQRVLTSIYPETSNFRDAQSFYL